MGATELAGETPRRRDRGENCVVAWVTTIAFYHPARRPPAEYDAADGGRATRLDRLGAFHALTIVK
jgi:hypothetical protein